MCSLLAALTAGAAVVYKWTDADGVVHFSDQAVPGAERIVTSSSPTNGIGGATRASGPAPAMAATGAVRYSVLSIESPAPEQVFFNDEVVPVRLHLVPDLQPNQRIHWQLNGKTLEDQAPDAMSFALQQLPRGTYSVAATVTDSGTGDAQSTAGVTFYVRQPSELSPQHQKH